MKTILNKNLTHGIWHDKLYNLEGEFVLENSIIKIYLTKFWNDVMVHLEKDQIVLLFYRILLGNTNHREFSPTF
jgi:hypothetical protein